MIRKVLPWLLAVMLLFAGCAAMPETNKGSTAPPGYDYDVPRYDEGAAENGKDIGGSSGLSIGVTNPEQKIIYTVTYQMETKDFAAATEQLKSITAELGGYIENSEISSLERYGYALRTGTFTLRIPTDKLNGFFAVAGDIGHIVQEKLESTDVTLQFVDTQARLKALETQEERILAILKDATELKYVLEIERELANIRSEIESLTSTLNRLSSLVTYSTVHVNLREVASFSEMQPVPKSFGERLSAEFQRSLQRLYAGLQEVGIWFFGNILEIVFWVGIIVLAAWILSRIVRKARKRAREKAIQRYEAALYSSMTEGTQNQANDNQKDGPKSE